MSPRLWLTPHRPQLLWGPRQPIADLYFVLIGKLSSDKSAPPVIQEMQPFNESCRHSCDNHSTTLACWPRTSLCLESGRHVASPSHP